PAGVCNARRGRRPRPSVGTDPARRGGGQDLTRQQVLAAQYRQMKSTVKRYWKKSRFPIIGNSNAAPSSVFRVILTRPPIAAVTRLLPLAIEPKLITSRPSPEMNRAVPLVVYWNQFTSTIG